MFVIEQVVQSEKFKNLEVLTPMADPIVLQTSECHHSCSCSKFIPELNKIAAAVGKDIIFFDTDNKSYNWLTDGARISLRKKSGMMVKKTSPKF